MKTGLKAALVVGSSALYFGLAVLGFGGLAPFFSHGALVALAAGFAVLVVVSLFSGGNVSPGVREDRGNRWVLWAISVLGLLGGYLPALSDRHEFWTMDGDALRWAGVALFDVGGALRLWPVFVLGKRFSGLVAIQPGHTLVTTGIFGLIRNPSYLGLLINSLGWGLAFRSGVGVVLTGLIIPVLIGRIRSEERLLQSEFGSQYEAYCKRTWRLVPWVY